MKIAITGSAGFIGMHLSQFLARNGYSEQLNIDFLNPIYGPELSTLRTQELKKEGLSIDQIDLSATTPKILAEKLENCEIVIHLAANAGVRTSAVAPYSYSQSNVNGFVNLLEAIRLTRPSLFMFASSSSVYGNSPTIIQDEESANGLNLNSYYAATKWTNEILARSYANAYNLNMVALRFFTVYGNYGRPDMAYMSFMKSLVEGRTIEIYGTDGGKRSYTHISDVVKTIYELINSPKIKSQSQKNSTFFNALNIGNEENSSAIEILKILESSSKLQPQLKFVARPSFDVDSTKCSMDKTFTYIPKFEFLKIEKGIAAFASWYLDYFLKQLPNR